MVQPSDISGYVDIIFGSWGGGIFQGIQYFLLLVLVFGVFGILYYYISFPYKVTVFPLYGSGKDGVFSIGRPKKNRVKWIKNKTAWKKMYPLLSRKEIEPFDSEYIYPGKRIYAFELNGEWSPGRINIQQTEEQLRAEINIVPYHIRNWQSMQHKRHAMEFSGNSFWDENKALFIGMIVSLGCLIAVCVTIYFVVTYAGGVGDSISKLAKVLEESGNIPGIPGTPAPPH